VDRRYTVYVVRQWWRREISHVPQQQVVGGVLAASHFRRGRRPEVLVPVAAGYQQQFTGRAHLPLVQRLPSQFREVLRQMADQRQESHVARVTVRYAWRTKTQRTMKPTPTGNKYRFN